MVCRQNCVKIVISEMRGIHVALYIMSNNRRRSATADVSLIPEMETSAGSRPWPAEFRRPTPPAPNSCLAMARLSPSSSPTVYSTLFYSSSSFSKSISNQCRSARERGTTRPRGASPAPHASRPSAAASTAPRPARAAPSATCAATIPSHGGHHNRCRTSGGRRRSGSVRC